MFPEERIFRIDHYLGKESVEDLLVFRFSNTLLEPVWNRNYVRSVQITMSETIGVEGRGSFYDSVGAIRDVMQNHLLQVAGAGGDGAAGRPGRQLPAGREGQGVRGDATDRPDEARARPVRRLPRRAGRRRRTRPSRRSPRRAWRSTRGDGPACRGTSAAARRCEASATEVVVEFREPPSLLFDEAGGPPPARNLVRFRLGSKDGVTFTLQAKTPGPHLDSQNVDVAVDFAAALGERHEAYERLLDDAIAGLPRRFAREDVVELTWRVVQPALDTPGPVHPYFRGEWGPAKPTASSTATTGSFRPSRRCPPGTVARPPLVPGENPALPELGSSPVSSHEGRSARRWWLPQR